MLYNRYLRNAAPEAATLRISRELDELLKRTAKHANCPETTVIRRTAIGIDRGRPVVEREIENVLYKTGPVVKQFNFALPVEAGEFRRLLALRCLEELDHKPRIRRSFAEEAGIDYIVEEME